MTLSTKIDHLVECAARVSHSTEEAKLTSLEDVMLASRPGVLRLCEALSSILPGTTIMRNGYDFVAVLSKIAWIGSYTVLEGTHIITIRKFSRRRRQILLRGTETFDSLADAILFTHKIVEHGQLSRKRKATSIENDPATIEMRAHTALAESITDAMRAADLRAVASVGL